MRVVGSVARQTFQQCFRSRAVVVTLLLLAVLLVLMPFVLQGDDTLAGRVRTFLSYATAALTMTLSALTVFFSVILISEDVRTRRVFILAVKPVARWQYVLGRWIGMAMLNAVLLVIAGGGIYVLAQQMRSGAMGPAINAADRTSVETEVFTARKRVGPVIEVDYDRLTQDRLEMMDEQGSIEPALAMYASRYETEDEAMEALYQEIYKQVSQQAQSRGPGDPFQWRFEGLDLEGQSLTREGTVRVRMDTQFRVEAPPEFLGRLIYGGPVRINGAEAYVTRLETDFFDLKLFTDTGDTSGVVSLAKGDTVTLTAEPTIQLTYKASSATYPPDGLLRCWWQLENPETGFRYRNDRKDAVRKPVTLTLSGRVIGRAVSRSRWLTWRSKELMREEGLSREEADAQAADEPVPTLKKAPASCVTWATDAMYLNLPHHQTKVVTSVVILDDDISILFKVSSFESNMVRGLLLVQCQLMYLAALGLVAGSFLSFPVGVLATFTVLPFAMARMYLLEGMQSYGDEAGWYQYWGGWMMKGMVLLMPNLEASAAGAFWVDGMVISWGFLMRSIGTTLGVHTVLALLLACWIYSRRELARVQV
jgi:hypothetical protein